MKISPDLLERIKEDYEEKKAISWAYIMRKYKTSFSIAKFISDGIKNATL